MLAWKSTDGARLCAAAGLLALCVAAAADFKVVEARARLADRTLEMAGNVEIALTSRVEEALSKGIELSLLINVRLKRNRRFLWDPTVAAWDLNRRISYHALSNQYLVQVADRAGGQPLVESYTSLTEALKALGVLDLKLPLVQTSTQGVHHIELRVALDIEALPAPLRPVAYTSPAWYLDSGWTTWPVTH